MKEKIDLSLVRLEEISRVRIRERFTHLVDGMVEAAAESFKNTLDMLLKPEKRTEDFHLKMLMNANGSVYNEHLTIDDIEENWMNVCINDLGMSAEEADIKRVECLYHYLYDLAEEFGVSVAPAFIGGWLIKYRSKNRIGFGQM